MEYEIEYMKDAKLLSEPFDDLKGRIIRGLQNVFHKKSLDRKELKHLKRKYRLNFFFFKRDNVEKIHPPASLIEDIDR